MKEFVFTADTTSSISRVSDYISQVIGFRIQCTKQREKKDARGFGIKTQVLKSSKSTDQANNMDVTDFIVEMYPIDLSGNYVTTNTFFNLGPP